MFANFIYFIIVLLIYTSHFPPEEPNIDPVETVIAFIGLVLIFTLVTWLQFQRLEKQTKNEHFINFDHKFDAIVTRQSIFAVLLFAVNIYGQNLTLFFNNIPFFSIFPSFQALVFIGLFIGYLSIIWCCSYRTLRLLNRSVQSLPAYLLSNISFSIPVLIPWLLLSLVLDLINLLPFETVRRFFSTTQGQMTYSLVFLLIIAMIGPAMIRRFWRCKPLVKGIHRDRIEDMCKRAGVGHADILLWPVFGGRMITAGVLGLVKKFRYILVTSGLLRFLEPVELDAVIAHEIGHVKHRHMLFYLFFFVGYMLISYASLNLIVFFIYYAQSFFLEMQGRSFNSQMVTSTFFSFMIIIVFLVYFRYIFGYFLRNFERQADLYVYHLLADAQPLISTFEKIILISGQTADRPNWHHFSLKQRIDYLKNCEADRSWIDRHNKKVKKGIYAFFIGMVVVGTMSYSLNFGRAGSFLAERILLSEIKKTTTDPNLFISLGDVYYRHDNFSGAVKAYEAALHLDPDNSHALNNLAWLYATCPATRFFNPQKALKLAIKAAGLKAEPHILDTLAESYYVNKMFKKAAETQRRAIELLRSNPIKGQDPRDYEKRLEKFTDAVSD